MAQTNSGNSGEMKWVRQTEMAVMQFVIMSKASEMNGVTKENLQQVFTRDVPMNYGDHLDHCIGVLTQTGHLRQDGNKYVPTDDGREDVQKLERVFLSVPQMIGSGGRQQNSTGMTTGAQGSTAENTRLGGTTNSVMQTNAVGSPKGGPDNKTR